MSTIEIVGPIVEANAESNLESCNMHKMDSSQSLPQEARSDAWWINFERARDNPSLSHVSSSTGSSGECCETSFPLPSKRPCNPQGYAGFLQECIEGRSHTPAKKNSPRFVSLHDDQGELLIPRFRPDSP